MTTNHYAPIPYKSARLPCAAATSLLALTAAAAVGGLLLSVAAVPAAGAGRTSMTFGAARIGFALAQAGLWTVSLAALLWWLASAYRNLPALGAPWPAFTPGQAVAWWFVPPANLYLPFREVFEMWRASDPSRQRPEGYAVPDAHRAWPATWWVAFLAGAVAVVAGVWAVFGLGPGPVQRLAAVASHAVVLASSGLTIWMVRRITEWQARHYRLVVGDALAHHAACLDPSAWRTRPRAEGPVRVSL
jgi:hypothetical protein